MRALAVGAVVVSSDVVANLPYRLVVEKCAAGLAVLDIEGRFEEVNPAFCDLTGYSREALSQPGFGLDKLLHLDEVTICHQHLVALSRGEEESYQQQQQLVRQDGVVLWVELSVNLIRRDGGTPHRLVVTAIDITEQRRAESAFRDMSFRDALTRLPNRRLLRDRLESALAHARRAEQKVAVLFLDLDGFKPINDTLGHQTGDWLLKAVAQRLVSCLRDYDTAARLGGDEFVVLLPDLSLREDASRIAERIRAAVAAPFVTDDGKQLEVSASIGVSLYPEHANSARDLLQASDAAMYVAKQEGRNRIAYSDQTGTPAPTPVMVGDVQSGLVHLAWEASFACGNAFIDAEHRELFRQSNRLLDLTMRPEVRAADVRAALQSLVRSVEAHFRHEERILSQVGYPGLQAHAARHRRLLERARDLCRRSIEPSVLVADILNFVVAEMIHGHVVTEDRDFFPLLKDGAGAVPEPNPADVT